MTPKFLDRISFISTFLVIFFLPIFFLPFLRVPVETSKGALLVAGTLVSLIFWVLARFFERKLAIPRSPILLFAFGILISFLLSSLFSSSPSVSFLGITFEVGTFSFMLVSFLLLLVISLNVRDEFRARSVLAGFLISSFLLLIFQLFHLKFTEISSFGVLLRNTDNLLGSWSALGVLSGLLVVLSLFFLEFVSLLRTQKIFLYTLLFISLIFAILTNFYLVFVLVGLFALIIFVFRILSFYNQKESSKNFPFLSLGVVLVSVALFISTQFISNFLPSRLGISSAEVSPSAKTTFIIGGKALKEDPVLGVGPNKFKEVWARHKPASINNTIFWNTDFEFGFGVIPTFVITTGILGALVWISFFYFLGRSGLKSVIGTIKQKTTPESSAFFLASLYLFISAFFYPIGAVLLVLAFVFSGVFVGLSSSGDKDLSVSFSLDDKKTFIWILGLSVLVVGSILLSFKFFERFISVTYFGKSLSYLSGGNIAQAENNIIRAVRLNKNDLYLRAYSQIYLAKLNSKIRESRNPDQNARNEMQDSLDRAVAAAELAIQYDGKNYVNFRAQGLVYEALTVAGVSLANERAVESYQKASALNPLNPGLKVSLARSYLAMNDLKNAKLNAEQAVALKPNFAEGLVVFSQILNREGDKTRALNYANQALNLFPDDKSIIDYVNSLK